MRNKISIIIFFLAFITQTGFAQDKINREYRIDNELYRLTESGLYLLKDGEKEANRIFIGSSDLENNCLSFAKSKKAMFLGTASGLFIKYADSSVWQKTNAQLNDNVISALAVNPQNENIVYASCEKGLFKTSDNAKTWKRIFVTYQSEIPDEDQNETDSEETITQIVNIKDIAITDTTVYLACGQGIFFSSNQGESWQKMTNIGLEHKDIRSINIDNKNILVTTSKGIFKFHEKAWQNVNETENDYKEIDTRKAIENLFSGEPSIQAVQKAAIEYAEVNMNKIKNWRRSAQLKALMPELTLDFDRTVTTALGASYDRTQIGPQDWGVNLKWDIADIVWNDAQTSIDTRSRLTVQLRQDVLEQVTHLYFERKKLKAELWISPPDDEKESLEKQLQLEELTANLDGMTNGFFSNYSKK